MSCTVHGRLQFARLGWLTEESAGTLLSGPYGGDASLHRYEMRHDHLVTSRLTEHGRD